MRSNVLTRWLGPSLVAVIALIAFQLLAMPSIREAQADWAFLHAARLSSITRAQTKPGP